MPVIADLCLVPIDVGTSVSKYVAKCHEIFREFDIKVNLHAYGTNLEGEWKEVMAAIEKCHIEIHKMGAVRISSSLRIGTRVDKSQSMSDKIESVKAKLKP